MISSIVSTIDGRLYGIDANHVLWSIDTGNPLLSVSYSRGAQDHFLIEPIGDGAMFIHDSSNIKKLPFTLRQLVDHAPFKSNDGMLYVGSKHSDIVSVDIDTGLILLDNAGMHENVVHDIVEPSKLIQFARTRLNLLVFDGTSQPLWNITYYRYHSFDRSTSKSGLPVVLENNNDIVLPDLKLPVSSVMRIVSTEDGMKRTVDRNLNLLNVGSHGTAAQLYTVSFIRNTPFMWKLPLGHETAHATSSHDLIPTKQQFENPSCALSNKEFPHCLYESTILVHDFEPSALSIGINPPLLIDPPTASSYSLTYIYMFLTVFMAVSLPIIFLLKRNNLLSGSSNKKENADKKSKKKRSTKLKDNVIGNLTIFDNEVIGYGSNGTLVIKGKFQERQVAVKRLLSEFYELAENEIQLLLHSDYHPNVIRYFCVEKTKQFTFIALDYCIGSIFDLFDCESAMYDSELMSSHRKNHSKSSIIQEILRGLEHLHTLNIFHRDMKPQNILLMDINGKLVPVISDFGLCKKLPDGHSSFYQTISKSAGTFGWRAPELLHADSESNGDNKISLKVDIFATGLVLFFIITEGSHAFGDAMLRENNILHDKKNLDAVPNDCMTELDLICKMINHNPRDRPTVTECLKHPLFWSKNKQLQFLMDLSDRVDIEDRESSMFSLFEDMKQDTLGADNWIDKIDESFFDDLGKYRKYDGSSLSDLLRAIRNKKNHYHELPESVKDLLGQMPEGYIRYFTTRFPNLFISCFNFVGQFEILKQEPIFASYFC